MVLELVYSDNTDADSDSTEDASSVEEDSVNETSQAGRNTENDERER